LVWNQEFWILRFIIYSDKNPISDHQIILLKLLDSKIHAYKGSFPEFIRHEELGFLIRQLAQIGNQTMQVLVSVKEQGTILQPDQISNVYTGIILVLQMLNELFVLDEHHSMNIKQLLLDIKALSLVTG
jgi:hypothetical protein